MEHHILLTRLCGNLHHILATFLTQQYGILRSRYFAHFLPSPGDGTAAGTTVEISHQFPTQNTEGTAAEDGDEVIPDILGDITSTTALELHQLLLLELQREYSKVPSTVVPQ